VYWTEGFDRFGVVNAFVVVGVVGLVGLMGGEEEEEEKKK